MLRWPKDGLLFIASILDRIFYGQGLIAVDAAHLHHAAGSRLHRVLRLKRVPGCLALELLLLHALDSFVAQLVVGNVRDAVGLQLGRLCFLHISQIHVVSALDLLVAAFVFAGALDVVNG